MPNRNGNTAKTAKNRAKPTRKVATYARLKSPWSGQPWRSPISLAAEVARNVAKASRRVPNEVHARGTATIGQFARRVKGTRGGQFRNAAKVARNFLGHKINVVNARGPQRK